MQDENILVNLIFDELSQWKKPGQQLWETAEAQFFYTHLPWDSAFFGMATCRLQYVLHELSFEALVQACKDFVSQLVAEKVEYLFIEIPAEDIMLIQALNMAGLKSTETRLIYYYPNVQGFEYERFQVREATESDIPALRKVAADMRNNYDRFHAEPAFSQDQGDAFLAKYVEEGVKGYNDVVLLPNEEGVASNAFFSLNLMKPYWEKIGVAMSKIVLTAASAETNKGWHIKLMAESVQWLKARGTEVVYMPTQNTNRAVIRNCEKLGFRFGGSTHVLTARLSPA